MIFAKVKDAEQDTDHLRHAPRLGSISKGVVLITASHTIHSGNPTNWDFLASE